MSGLQPFWNKYAVAFHERLARLPQWQIGTGCILITLLIFYFDFLLGSQVTLAAFYAVPIALMSWFGGPARGCALAVLAVSLLEWSDYVQVHTSMPWVPVANGAVRIMYYIVFVLGLVWLRNLQINLRALAEDRAYALLKEGARNVRLEREMLEAAAREQRRIGQDLHDGLCQHLTGTALAGQVLVENLEGTKQAQARRLVELIEGGITLARGIAKGLYPIELQSDGLMRALEDFSAKTSELFGIRCRFVCDTPVFIETSSTAAHLYRIVQEAVSNAISHGHATEIEILLEESDSGIRLSVTDNGRGLPDPLPSDGMGLRTMADRVRSIGGQFSIMPGAMGGAEVVCVAPGRWIT